MVEMRVRVEHGHRQRGQLPHDVADPPYPEPGVKQDCALRADDQEGIDALELPGFGNREYARCDGKDLEPIVLDVGELECLDFGRRRRIAPGLCAGVRGERGKQQESADHRERSSFQSPIVSTGTINKAMKAYVRYP